MSLIECVKNNAELLEQERGIEPIVSMYLVAGRTQEGKPAYYSIGGQKIEEEDTGSYFYNMGRSLMRNSGDASLQALLSGIFDAMDEPLNEAMKGGER